MMRLTSTLIRHYFRPRDLPIYKHDTMVSMIPNFVNLRQHLDFLKANEGQIPPKVIGDLMAAIAGLKLPLDENWPEIVTHVKAIINEYNRYTITDLYRVTRHMAELGEANQEFWDLIERKMIGEGLARYLSEKEAAGLLWGLCHVNRGSEQLWKRLEKEVARHYMCLEIEELNDAIYGLEVSGKGDKNVVGHLKNQLKANQLALLP